MISVILYGRNDSYGYNLPKRAALSLNCIAEVLDRDGDEILFVDYNTPDDFPTFPEAIQDTLTPRARGLLRVLRVRPHQHARFAARTHLQALEPVARNVALRRSNPENRWVLSTNTDMIFVPRQGRGLSEVAATLPDGFYGLPRFEIPESLWELLDRLDPRGTIARVANWGHHYHLNEIVTLAEPAIRFDGPGDFQLMRRRDLFDLHGFDERMLLGWHVDSNIAVRLARRHGPVGDVLEDFFGYHCDHTRQVTPAHRPGAAQNDWRRFVSDVAEAVAPGQPDWGLADMPVEEVRLAVRLTTLHCALAAAVPHPMAESSHAAFSPAASGRVDYDAAHVAPFVIDALCCQPPGTRLGWFATRGDLLARVAVAWTALGFTAPILAAIDDGMPAHRLPPGAEAADAAAVVRDADVLVFDFALTDALRADPAGPMEEDPAVAAVLRGFREALEVERQRVAAGAPLRRFIGVNAINNQAGRVFTDHIGAPQSPFAARLRQGFMLNPPPPPFAEHDPPRELLADLLVHPAGRRENGAIAVTGAGAVFEGPFLTVAPGSYRCDAAITLTEAGTAVLEVTAGKRRLVARAFALQPGDVLPAMIFAIDPDEAPRGGVRDISVRLFASDGLAGNVTAVCFRAAAPPAATGGADITALLLAGPAGYDRHDGVGASGARGTLLTAVRTLPPGAHQFAVDYLPDPARLPRPGVVRLSAMQGPRLLSTRRALVHGVGPQRLALDLEVPPRLAEPVMLLVRAVTPLGGRFTRATLAGGTTRRRAAATPGRREVEQ